MISLDGPRALKSGFAQRPLEKITVERNNPICYICGMIREAEMQIMRIANRFAVPVRAK